MLRGTLKERFFQVSAVLAFSFSASHAALPSDDVRAGIAPKKLDVHTSFNIFDYIAYKPMLERMQEQGYKLSDFRGAERLQLQSYIDQEAIILKELREISHIPEVQNLAKSAIDLIPVRHSEVLQLYKDFTKDDFPKEKKIHLFIEDEGNHGVEENSTSIRFNRLEGPLFSYYSSKNKKQPFSVAETLIHELAHCADERLTPKGVQELLHRVGLEALQMTFKKFPKLRFDVMKTKSIHNMDIAPLLDKVTPREYEQHVYGLENLSPFHAKQVSLETMDTLIDTPQASLAKGHRYPQWVLAQKYFLTARRDVEADLWEKTFEQHAMDVTNAMRKKYYNKPERIKYEVPAVSPAMIRSYSQNPKSLTGLYRQNTSQPLAADVGLAPTVFCSQDQVRARRCPDLDLRIK